MSNTFKTNRARAWHSSFPVHPYNVIPASEGDKLQAAMQEGMTCGERHGNKRKAEAKTKVSKRRQERRDQKRPVETED
jgi:hypothetical protein